VHPCWTLADARAIMALARPGARVVQMGAGFIGCIIMEALAIARREAHRGRDGRPHGAAHDGPDRRRHDQALVRGKGVAVHTGARVDAIERDGTAVREGAACPPARCWRPTW
jgi:hypothetical protein